MSNGLFSGVALKPRMIVFDLDCTLWPFDCDVYQGHEFRKKNGVIVDSDGAEVLVCNDSSFILNSIKDEKDVLLACASRTFTTDIARQLVRLRGWHHLFDFMEIYPSCKVKHFTTLSQKTGVPFHEMIFFDDLSWNIQDARQLGIHAYLVPNGITVPIVRRAIREYERFASERRNLQTPLA